MARLHIEPNNSNIFVPKEGQRNLMCSNKKLLRCPSFGYNHVEKENEEELALDYLAKLLVEEFLNKKYEHRKHSRK